MICSQRPFSERLNLHYILYQYHEMCVASQNSFQKGLLLIPRPHSSSRLMACLPSSWDLQKIQYPDCSGIFWMLVKVYVYAGSWRQFVHSRIQWKRFEERIFCFRNLSMKTSFFLVQKIGYIFFISWYSISTQMNTYYETYFEYITKCFFNKSNMVHIIVTKI